jgi:AbiU2
MTNQLPLAAVTFKRPGEMVKLSANETRQALFMRINQAQVQHDLLSALEDATATGENLNAMNRNLRFFTAVESALFNSSIVLLYALYETRKDTINFNNLVKELKASIPKNQHDEYLLRISAIKPTWLRVGTLRNEMIGHQTLDRNLTAVQSKANLSYLEIDNLLRHARSLLFDISSRHFDTHCDFIDSSKRAVNHLLSALHTKNSLKLSPLRSPFNSNTALD